MDRYTFDNPPKNPPLTADDWLVGGLVLYVVVAVVAFVVGLIAAGIYHWLFVVS